MVLVEDMIQIQPRHALQNRDRRGVVAVAAAALSNQNGRIPGALGLEDEIVNAVLDRIEMTVQDARNIERIALRRMEILHRIDAFAGMLEQEDIASRAAIQRIVAGA